MADGEQELSGAPPQAPAPQAPQPSPAGPGIMRNILGVFLTGLQAGVSAAPGIGAPGRAAAAGAQAMGQSALNPGNADEVKNQQLDSSLHKAQLALMQVQIQRQLMIYHTQDPLLQNAKLASWIENGKMVMDNAAKGNGEITFTTAPDQDPNEAFQALNNEWMAAIKKGDYGVVPFASGDPSKPTLGLYNMKNSKWQGGDYWSTANPEDPENPIQTRIPDGVKMAGAAAVQKWGLTTDNRFEKDRHDKAQAALQAGRQAQQLQMFNARQDFERWKTQYQEANKNMRQKQAFIRTQNGEVQKAFQEKVTADKNLSQGLEKEGWWSNLTGRASSDTQALVEAKTAADANWAEVQKRYGISDAQVNAGPPKKATAPSNSNAGSKVRVQLKDGRTGTIDAKDFDESSMTRLP